MVPPNDSTDLPTIYGRGPAIKSAIEACTFQGQRSKTKRVIPMRQTSSLSHAEVNLTQALLAAAISYARPSLKIREG